MARQAIAATGPELVGLVVNLLTPLIGALLLPAAITLGLFFDLLAARGGRRDRGAVPARCACR